MDELQAVLVYIFGLCLILPLTKQYDVRLTDGAGSWQGKVQVRRSKQETWGPVCDTGFSEHEASVVCKQLNYTYSRVEKDVYKPHYPGIFVLDKVRCHGNETDIENCSHGEYGLHDCSSQNYAAGVCCSNSSAFGETRGDVFVSHCGASWLEAEVSCEAIGSTIMPPGGYYNRSFNVKPALVIADNNSFWGGNFFTPWMWSSGCFQVSDESKMMNKNTIATNSPQLCFQYCVMYSDSFLLSESLCACINSSSVRHALNEVMPSHCKLFCAGDRYRFCGTGNGAYWNLYTTTSNEIFFRVNSPGRHEINQCATIVKNDVGSKKLASENCQGNQGFICHQFTQNSTNNERDLLYFPNELVGAQDARIKCPSKSGHLMLVGERILQKEQFYSDYDRLWVDLSRVAVDVAPSLNHTTWKQWSPQWCYSITLNGNNAIVECTQRHLYTCSKDIREATTKGPGTGTSSGSGDAEKSELLHMVLIIVSALVVAMVIIVILVCWIRRSKDKSIGLCCHDDSRSRSPCDVRGTGTTGYTATFQADPSDERYAEIKERSENIYNEIADTPLLDGMGYEVPISARDSNMSTDSRVGLKAPVTMTRSYSHPRDMLDPDNVWHDEHDEDHPDYIYPYDKVYRNDMAGAKQVPGTEESDAGNKTSYSESCVVKSERDFNDLPINNQLPIDIESNKSISDVGDRATDNDLLDKHIGSVDVEFDGSYVCFTHSKVNAENESLKSVESNISGDGSLVHNEVVFDADDEVVLRKTNKADLVEEIFVNENRSSQQRNSAS